MKRDPLLMTLTTLALLIVAALIVVGVRQTVYSANDHPPLVTRVAAIALEMQPTSDAATPLGLVTLPPSWTPAPTDAPLDTFTPGPSDTATATWTPLPPTRTRTPTITPTFTPSRAVSPTPTALPQAGVPAPAAAIPPGGNDYFNILLIGSDKRPGESDYRTDTLLIVSINRTTQTVAMLSIPRDLYVYIQKHGFDRINTAAEYGDFMKWPGGGIDLLRSTVTWYTGIPIDRYARVNFAGFKQLIDGIGGVDVANDCRLSDYRVIAGRKEGVESNYAWTTLPVGVNHFDGASALWYARSRETTSDFDRARRQQLVLRAVLRKATEGGLLQTLPTLWPELTKIVDTNLNLGDVLSLLPLAAQIDSARLRSYVIGPPAVTDATSETGAMVLMPQREALRALMVRFYTPPTGNALNAEKPVIEIYNGSSHADWDQVAASRLAWEGFTPVLKGEWDGNAQARTTLYDFTGKAKPGSLSALTRIFALRSTQVQSAPDPNASADFRLVVKDDYTSCTFQAGNSVGRVP